MICDKVHVSTCAYTIGLPLFDWIGNDVNDNENRNRLMLIELFLSQRPHDLEKMWFEQDVRTKQSIDR